MNHRSQEAESYKEREANRSDRTAKLFKPPKQQSPPSSPSTTLSFKQILSKVKQTKKATSHKPSRESSTIKATLPVKAALDEEKRALLRMKAIIDQRLKDIDGRPSSLQSSPGRPLNKSFQLPRKKNESVGGRSKARKTNQNELFPSHHCSFELHSPLNETSLMRDFSDQSPLLPVRREISSDNPFFQNTKTKSFEDNGLRLRGEVLNSKRKVPSASELQGLKRDRPKKVIPLEISGETSKARTLIRSMLNKSVNTENYFSDIKSRNTVQSGGWKKQTNKTVLEPARIKDFDSFNPNLDISNMLTHIKKRETLLNPASRPPKAPSKPGYLEVSQEPSEDACLSSPSEESIRLFIDRYYAGGANPKE